MRIFLLKAALYNINLQCSWGSKMDGEKESCEEVKNGIVHNILLLGIGYSFFLPWMPKRNLVGFSSQQIKKGSLGDFWNLSANPFNWKWVSFAHNEPVGRTNSRMNYFTGRLVLTLRQKKQFGKYGNVDFFHPLTLPSPYQLPHAHTINPPPCPKDFTLGTETCTP